MPDPATAPDAFEEAALARIREYVLRTRGRAFVLFTSYQAMKRAASALAASFQEQGLRLFCQGDGLPRTQMIREFQRAGGEFRRLKRCRRLGHHPVIVGRDDGRRQRSVGRRAVGPDVDEPQGADPSRLPRRKYLCEQAADVQPGEVGVQARRERRVAVAHPAVEQELFTLPLACRHRGGLDLARGKPEHNARTENAKQNRRHKRRPCWRWYGSWRVRRCHVLFYLPID